MGNYVKSFKSVTFGTPTFSLDTEKGDHEKLGSSTHTQNAVDDPFFAVSSLRSVGSVYVANVSDEKGNGGKAMQIDDSKGHIVRRTKRKK